MPQRPYSGSARLLASMVITPSAAVSPGYGWGPGGHQQIADIAWDGLTPRA